MLAVHACRRSHPLPANSCPALRTGARRPHCLCPWRSRRPHHWAGSWSRVRRVYSVMHIALLHYSAPPVVGGVESVMAHQARQMAAAGHAVTLVAGRGAALDGTASFVNLPLLDSRHPRVLAVKAGLDGGQVPDDFARLSADIE